MNAGKRPRIGRPPAADSARRRSDIITAARRRFVESGYAATTLSAIAQDAGITLSALYHYFEEKSALFEAVYFDTIEDNWAWIRAALDDESAAPADLIEVVFSNSAEIDRSKLMFLTLVAPIEAVRHPELRHLLEHRAKFKEAQIRAVVEPAFQAGRLPGFPAVDTAVMATRIIGMGWGLESFIQESEGERLLAAARFVFEQFSQPPTGAPSGDEENPPESAGENQS
jgi:AcrR family transcriptional regulator